MSAGATRSQGKTVAPGHQTKCGFHVRRCHPLTREDGGSWTPDKVRFPCPPVPPAHKGRRWLLDTRQSAVSMSAGATRSQGKTVAPGHQTKCGFHVRRCHPLTREDGGSWTPDKARFPCPPVPPAHKGRRWLLDTRQSAVSMSAGATRSQGKTVAPGHQTKCGFHVRRCHPLTREDGGSWTPDKARFPCPPVPPAHKGRRWLLDTRQSAVSMSAGATRSQGKTVAMRFSNREA